MAKIFFECFWFKLKLAATVMIRPQADTRTHTAFFELQDSLNPEKVLSNSQPIRKKENSKTEGARETLVPGLILSSRLKYLIKASVNRVSDQVGIWCERHFDVFWDGKELHWPSTSDQLQIRSALTQRHGRQKNNLCLSICPFCYFLFKHYSEKYFKGLVLPFIKKDMLFFAHNIILYLLSLSASERQTNKWGEKHCIGSCPYSMYGDNLHG